MKKLKAEEVLLIGKWIINGKSVKSDSTSRRIEWLVSDCLVKIGEDKSGWNTLYKDPEDSRYWELTYPNGELQGGGPPRLENISIQEAEKSTIFKNHPSALPSGSRRHPSLPLSPSYPNNPVPFTNFYVLTPTV